MSALIESETTGLIELECEQGSGEWLRARLGIPTASCFDKIMTPKTRKPSSQAKGYRGLLLAEWLAGIPFESVETAWMTRGHELEPEAVRYYHLQADCETRRVGFVLRGDRAIGCSPDRLIGEDGGLEIKCPSPAVHMGYLMDGTVATEYMHQIQGCMWITGRAYWDVLSYHPMLPPALVRVERDEGYIDCLADLVGEFVASLIAAKVSLSDQGHHPRIEYE